TTSSAINLRPVNAAANIRGSGFRVRSSSEYTRTSNCGPIPTACWSFVRYRPQLRPVFEMSPIANPLARKASRVSRTCGKKLGGRTRIAPPRASLTRPTIAGSRRSMPASRSKRSTWSSGLNSRWRAQACTTAQRGPIHLHIERGEEETLRLVEIQEFGEPPKEKGRDVVRFEADFDLSDLFDRVEIRDEAEHPLGGVREQLVQRGPVRAD